MAFLKLQELYEEELYQNVSILANFYVSNHTFFNLSQEEIFCTLALNGSR